MNHTLAQFTQMTIDEVVGSIFAAIIVLAIGAKIAREIWDGM